MKFKNIKQMIRRKIVSNPIVLWPTETISNKFGVERGNPIDRVFINRFLGNNRKYIHDIVYEIGDNEYTLKYGKNCASKIFTADENDDRNNIIVGDLQSGLGCDEKVCDCFILTQTLPFIFDINSAVKNIMKMLKPNGVALVTVSGISMISMYDYERWGHYWGFTEQSIKKLFIEIGKASNVDVISYGNPKLASGFIYGLSEEDYKKEDFDYNDTVTPVTICAVIKK